MCRTDANRNIKGPKNVYQLLLYKPTGFTDTYSDMIAIGIARYKCLKRVLALHFTDRIYGDIYFTSHCKHPIYNILHVEGILPKGPYPLC